MQAGYRKLAEVSQASPPPSGRKKQNVKIKENAKNKPAMGISSYKWYKT